MTGTSQPHDQVASLTDLQERFPGHEVCLIRRMPPGLRWCVDENVIYVRADEEPPRSTLDIMEAMTQLEGYRPTLVALDGGRVDQPIRAERMPATGSD